MFNPPTPPANRTSQLIDMTAYDATYSKWQWDASARTFKICEDSAKKLDGTYDLSKCSNAFTSSSTRLSSFGSTVLLIGMCLVLWG